jgi:hypothetical protein
MGLEAALLNSIAKHYLMSGKCLMRCGNGSIETQAVTSAFHNPAYHNQSHLKIHFANIYTSRVSNSRVKRHLALIRAC